MKRMMMIAAVIGMAALTQAASLNWSSGTVQFRTEDDSAFLQNTLAQLMVFDGAEFVAVDTATTLSTVGNKGKISGVWDGAEGYTVAAYPAGTDFFIRVWDTADTSGQYMDLYANGVNNAEPTYWELTAIADTDGAQTLNLALEGYSSPQVFTPVPEPTSMALLALGVAAIGLRRKFRA